MAAAASSVNEHLRITIPLNPVPDTSTILLHLDVALAFQAAEMRPGQRITHVKNADISVPIDRAEHVDFGIRSPGASPRPIAAEGFCGLLATLGDFIHSDHHHPWTLPMNGAHNHNAVR
jgi:hypothetical protein